MLVGARDHRAASVSGPAGVPVPVRWRLPVLAAGAVALLAGLYAGLLLLGAAVPAPAVPVEEVHGPLMVLGFVGVLSSGRKAGTVVRSLVLLAG